MKKPTAPASAVEHITSAFGGVKVNIPENDEWIVTFNNKDDANRCRLLVGMLNGWSADVCVETRNAIKISGE